MPDEIEAWLAETVLPKKAPWIARASGSELDDAVWMARDIASRVTPGT